MGEAIGQALPLAVGVALSPLPIVAVVLMLVTPRARANGPAFVVGWLVGLAIVGAIVLAVADPADAGDDGEPATWVSILELALGAGLVLLAIRQWTGRPHEGEEAAMPKWMGALDSFTAPKTLGAGAVLSGANPKNLLLAVAAATTIAKTGISGGEQAVAYAIFALIGTIGVAVLRPRRPRPGPARPPEGLDGPEQCRDHGRAVPDHRREADRRRDRRPVLRGRRGTP
jgi:threonine/homoserine/homoserine lactone efflux protein